MDEKLRPKREKGDKEEEEESLKLQKTFSELDPKLQEDIREDLRQKMAAGMSQEDIIKRAKPLIREGDYLSKMDPSFSDLVYAPQPPDEESKLMNEVDDVVADADEPEDFDKLIKDAEKPPEPPQSVH